MILEQRINLLSQLGDYLLSDDEYLKAVMHRTAYHNQWLSVENCNKAAKAIGKTCLRKTVLEEWVHQYGIPSTIRPKKIGIVVAGNVPLAGLQDIICTFAAGHQSWIKLAEKDEYLLAHLIKKMIEWEAEAATYFQITDFLKGFDAIIASNTGKNSRYFERYFSQYPNIIRKEQHSLAVLDGKETSAELLALGEDVLAYYGLGANNVSKLYVPESYQFEPLLEALHEYRAIILNNKYKNNFDYNYALLMLNNSKYLANACIILREEKAIASRIACLHYEFYKDTEEVVRQLSQTHQDIKYIVSRTPLIGINTILPGNTQIPSLYKYPDGVDTMEFLMNLSRL